MAVSEIIICGTSSAKYRDMYLQPTDIYEPANRLKDNEITTFRFNVLVRKRFYNSLISKIKIMYHFMLL